MKNDEFRWPIEQFKAELVLEAILELIECLKFTSKYSPKIAAIFQLQEILKRIICGNYQSLIVDQGRRECVEVDHNPENDCFWKKAPNLRDLQIGSGARIIRRL